MLCEHMSERVLCWVCCDAIERIPNAIFPDLQPLFAYGRLNTDFKPSLRLEVIDLKSVYWLKSVYDWP